uniref:RNMT-activating mini protein n=1 Tax=Anopheles stephensi TaxID=30069 RepID=A0A182XX19_ANOST
MVDPKRHINILSPEEQAFMEECENEFTHRFTDLDEEFMAHCQRESKPPPVVHPWNSRRGGGHHGGGGGGARGGGNVEWRGERRFNDWDGRGGGRGGPFNNRDGRNRQNDRNYRHHGYRSGGGGGGGRDDGYQNHRNHSASRQDYRKPYARPGDRAYNQEAKR